MRNLILSLLVLCLAVFAASCADDPEPTAIPATATPQPTATPTSSSEGQGSGTDSSGTNGAAVATNPGFTGVGLDISRNVALAGAEPLGVVTWTDGPAVGNGELSASGRLADGYTLFNPMVDGEGAGFIVYYKGNLEPLALLLPDAGATHTWDTPITVATMEHEFEGQSFSFTAYSPLFMDVGAGDLEIAAFGYDSTGTDAVLGVQTVGDPSGGSSGANQGGTGTDGVVSATNPGFTGVGLDISRNNALAGAEPLDVVNWTGEPAIEGSALSAHGVLDHGYTLFNPMVDGDGASFIVYYKGNSEPLALLLPDLGPMQIWETDHTVATMEHEFEGESFSFTAYSPLFMDVGPGDLELRVFGYDSTSGDERNIKDALLAVIPVAVE